MNLMNFIERLKNEIQGIDVGQKNEHGEGFTSAIDEVIDILNRELDRLEERRDRE